MLTKLVNKVIYIPDRQQRHGLVYKYCCTFLSTLF